MIPTVADIIKIIEIIAPPNRSEPWDNSGLQIGNPDATVKKAAVSLDISESIVQVAVDKGVDLLICHHPLFFPSICSIDIRDGAGRITATVLRTDISVYCAHTNLDHALESTSHAVARRLGLVDLTPLSSAVNDDHDHAYRHHHDKSSNGDDDGILYLGGLASPMKLIDFARVVKKQLAAPLIRIAGNPEMTVSRAAVCAGSGGDFIKTARQLGADVLITGEVKHHDALSAAESGFGLIEAGHYWSELPVIFETARIITEESRNHGWSLDVTIIEGKDPFSYIYE